MNKVTHLFPCFSLNFLQVRNGIRDFLTQFWLYASFLTRVGNQMLKYRNSVIIHFDKGSG